MLKIKFPDGEKLCSTRLKFIVNILVCTNCIVRATSSETKDRFNSFAFLHLILTLGLNFIKVPRTAFTHADHKSVKFQLSCQYLFTLFGSACLKAVLRTLMKLTLDAINISFSILTMSHVWFVNEKRLSKRACFY